MSSSEKWLKDQRSKNLGETWTFPQVRENAMDRLDEYIKSKYSERVRLRNLASRSDNQSFDVEYYERVKQDVIEVKKLAYMFNLYPFNQPRYHFDPNIDGLRLNNYGRS